METRQFKVETFKERAYCEDCGGELKFSSPMLTASTYPPSYYHQCSKCNKVYNLDCIYPRIVYKEIEEEKENGK